MAKLRFKHHYHVEIVPPDRAFLFSEKDDPVMLSGKVFAMLAPLLNGQYTEQEILDQLEGKAFYGQILYNLARLRQGGYLVEVDGPLPLPAGIAAKPSEFAAFWELLGSSAEAAACQLAQATVTVQTLGDIDAALLVAILETMGVRVGQPGDLDVILTDDYLQPELADLNTRALEIGRPWLLIKPLGVELWLGPLFVPGQTGCWQCLANRLAAKRQIDEFVQRQKGLTTFFPIAQAGLASTLQAGLHLAATEIVKWLVAGESPTLVGQVFTLDARTLATRMHKLVKRPQCPVCGVPTYRAQAPPAEIVLHSSPKRYTLDGGHRAIMPETLWAWYGHHVSPITGVVERIEPALEVENVVYVYSGIHDGGRKFRLEEDIRFKTRLSCAGKGVTRAQARASVLGEALERYSLHAQPYDYCRRASFEDLGELAIHPNDCMLYSQNQYQNRTALNARKTRLGYVPLPFDPGCEIDWTPLWSLRDQTYKYLPTAYCRWGWEPKGCFCATDSNGCAAGHTLEEAILQGFLELVERDCLALWWYNRLSRPAVDLASFGHSLAKQTRDYYTSREREVWALDLTNDLDIPTFVAFSRRLKGDPGERICLGAGTHFDPHIALRRALTESAQVLVNADKDLGRDLFGGAQPDLLDWLKTATVANQPYLAPDRNAPVKTVHDFPYHDTGDLRDDVLQCLEIVRSRGMDLLVLDQTRPDIGLRVVRVVVPGLRNIVPSFALGRLYDVPVRLGWLERPLAEDELNPIPWFF